MKIKGIVQATSAPKEYQGVLQIGFMIDDRWYNIDDEDKDNLEKVRKVMLKKGNEIEFDFDEQEGSVENLKVLTETKEEPKSESKGKWEDDMVNFKDLLNAAHKKGLTAIKTEMLTIDLEKKYALFKACVYGKFSEDNIQVEFEGHGDATANNVTGDFIKPHFIRMAETRAIVRALRWYTNNATCAEEEK